MAASSHEHFGNLKKWRLFNAKYAAIAQQQINDFGIDFANIKWGDHEEVTADQINAAYKKAFTPVDEHGNPTGEGPDGDWPETFPFVTGACTLLVWQDATAGGSGAWDEGWFNAFMSFATYRTTFQMAILGMVLQLEEIWQVGTGGRGGLLPR